MVPQHPDKKGKLGCDQKKLGVCSFPPRKSVKIGIEPSGRNPDSSPLVKCHPNKGRCVCHAQIQVLHHWAEVVM